MEIQHMDLLKKMFSTCFVNASLFDCRDCLKGVMNLMGNFKCDIEKNAEITWVEERMKKIFHENDEIVDLSMESSNSLISLAESLGDLSDIYELKKDFKNALEFRMKSLDLYKEMNMEKEIADGLLSIGGIYFSLDEFDDSLKYYKMCLNMRQQIEGEGTENIATVLNNIGGVYDCIGEHEKALKYCKESLEIDQSNEDYYQIARGLGNIAGIYFTKEEYIEALHYYEKCVDMWRKVREKKSSIEIADVLEQIGRIYRRRREYGKSLDYYFESMEMKKKIGEEFVDNLENVAYIYYKKKEYDEAILYYNEVLNQWKSKGEVSDEIADTLFQLGKTHKRKEDWDEAILYFEKCLTVREQLGGEGEMEEEGGIADCLDSIANIYWAKGDKLKTLKYGWKLANVFIPRLLLYVVILYIIILGFVFYTYVLFNN